MGNQYDADSEIEIDLKDLLFELLNYWKLILFAVFISGAIGFAVSEFLIVPQYESTSELYVLSKSTSITSLADIQTGTSLTNDYMVVVQGRPVLEQVIENLGIQETYNSLSKKISLTNPSNSRILQITVTHEDPQMAKLIADEIAEVGAAYISVTMDQDPPNIIQYGYADGSPVSPNIAKNTLIGALIGAFLSMAIIVMAYLFNDTIMEPEDIEKKLGMNVLGTLPLEESEDDGKKKSGRGRKKKKKQETHKESA
jgi:capsular polysaccharide biosynthesis protein